MRTSALEIAGGVQIVVPYSLNPLTPYVLFEQRDWFEDEIRFVRRLLRPGQQTIDIGANYGVYTLTMAKIVGPTRAVWAFEPASSTVALLARGIDQSMHGGGAVRELSPQAPTILGTSYRALRYRIRKLGIE